MAKRCEICVGKPYCSCKKTRVKDKSNEPPPPRTHHRGFALHKWTAWKLAPLQACFIRSCERCGRIRVKKI